MQRHTGERGAALILLLGITAALAILTGTLVMVLANQQGATASERSHKTSLYYAEAALDSAVNAAKGKTDVQTAGFLTPEEMAVNYDAAYPSGPNVTYRVYDNQTPVNTAITCDEGKPGDPTDPDGMVWLEVTTSYLGKTSRLRVLVVQTTESVVQAFPKAALFSDADIYLNGSSDIYAVNDDGTAYVPNPPGNYLTKIMAGGDVRGNSNTNFAAPGSNVQSVGVQANGTVSGTATGDTGVTHGGVPLLSDYFNQADQANLMFEAQTGAPTQANASGTSVSPSKFTPSQLTTSYLATINASFNSSTNTYTFANDLVVSGSLTLKTGSGYFPAGTIFNFESLYVNGALTLNGSTTTNTTALYVRDNFTISGPTGVQQFGPTFVGHSAIWSQSGTTPLSVQTTNHQDASAAPGPLWVGYTIEATGLYNHVLGPTWVVGNPGTSDVAVNFEGPSSGTHSTVLCPLMSTTEKTTTSGKVDFGTLEQPMIFYMACDNDNLYTNTCIWNSSGTFTGLMVVMEAAINPGGGNDGIHPNIVGALFCIKDVTIGSNTSICYNQAVLEHLQSTAITTTTTKTTVLSGTWQELSPNSP